MTAARATEPAMDLRSLWLVAGHFILVLGTDELKVRGRHAIPYNAALLAPSAVAFRGLRVGELFWGQGDFVLDLLAVAATSEGIVGHPEGLRARL